MKLLIIVIIVLLAFIFWQTVPPRRADLISDNYFSLREEFRKAVAAQGGALESLPIQARGSQGEELTIESAWFGSASPNRVLLHISGTHGVEGYAGSAIQSRIINQGFTPPADSAVWFIHALNPWGMAEKRRFNENNADLNRNFLLAEDQFKGAPESYRLIENFLNPAGPPSRIDLFYPEAAYNVAVHGFNALKQAIAGGQYEFPRGIYYGGARMEESLRILKELLPRKLTGVKELYVIEIHTGLGDWAKDVLFWPLSLKDPKSIRFSTALGETLSTDAPDEGVGFRTPGDLQNEAPKVIPEIETYWLLQEFGAYGPVRTLRALRDENRFYHDGGKDLNHWSKQMLLEAFSPGDTEWQTTILTRGQELFNKMLPLLNQDGKQHIQ